MSRIPFAVFAAVAMAGLAHGQSTLDWSSTSAWSNGSTTGSYNFLTNAAGRDGTVGATALITPLTYDFGGGLTATVSAFLGTDVKWQVNGNFSDGTSDRAPIVNSNGLYAFGINNGSSSTGATLTFNFNQAVTLNSVTVGDIDFGGDVLDLVNVFSNTGALSVIGSASGAPTFANSPANLLAFTGVGANEGTFGTGATTGWSTVSSGSTLINSLTVSLLNGSGNHGIWLNNLSVSAIPEPSTYALVLGGCTLALIVFRRRVVRRS